MKAAFRVDATPEIGGGHFMRCLVLASSLADQGADICFLTNRSIPVINPQELGFSLIEAPVPHSPLAPLLAAAFPSTGADLLVVDHYSIPESVELAARAQARVILAFDDMPTRRHHCDLLVDQNFGADPADYASLVPDDTIILAGSQFALLRDEFVLARSKALEQRAAATPKGVMVCFGMSDQNGLTFEAVQALRSIDYESQINVVIGSSSANLEKIRMLADADGQIVLAIDPDEIAPVMVRSAVAIGGGGSMHWERCCLGLPTICLVLGENQRSVSERLMRAGAIDLVFGSKKPSAHDLACRAVALEKDIFRREEMSMLAAAVCDGLGAHRLVNAIMASTKRSP